MLTCRDLILAFRIPRTTPLHLLHIDPVCFHVFMTSVVAFGLLASGVACSKSPASPASLPVRSGRSLLQIQGFDASADPNLPPCQPIGVPARGKTVWADLNVQSSGDEWTAKSLAASDDIEIRFHSDGSATLQGVAVEGSILASVVDIGTLPYVSPRNVRASFAGTSETQPAELTGSVNRQGFMSGRISGNITFTDTLTGTSGSCLAVSFSLQPYPQ